MRWVSLSVLLLLPLSGCGDATVQAEPAGTSAVAIPSTPAAQTRPGVQPTTGPPPFRVRAGGREFDLPPYTFCYSQDGVGVCADGSALHPPTVGSPEQILVYVPVPAFDVLSADQFRPGRVGTSISAEVTSVGDGWWRVRPNGEPGKYQLSIFASDSDTGVGDMVADVLWTVHG